MDEEETVAQVVPRVLLDLQVDKGALVLLDSVDQMELQDLADLRVLQDLVETLETQV